MKGFRTICLIVLLSCTLTGTMWAQATAQMSGTVKDQSGAVLPGVEVTVRQTDTGVARGTVTNETGTYVLPNLALGPYRLEASLPGFRTFVQSGIVLQVGSDPVINPILEVGQVSEQVEVQANAALVETRNQGVGQVIENARILELPLNGRNVTELITLTGGTVTGGAGAGSGAGAVFNRAGGVTIAGGLGFGVSYILDGAMHNNPYNGLNISVPFPDALQEFKVETSALSAQSGMHSAGAVNLVTKAGTNEIHGDLFEFVRNGKFNARNTFALKRDTLKRNQFGGTLGGPVIKNRLFFFGGYQGTTTRQDPSDILTFVPTAAMLAGDFTTITSPACNAGRQIALRAPFVSNRIDPALFSKAALNVTAKLPKTDDPCGRYVYGNPIKENYNMAVGKLDYQQSAKSSMFGRYLIEQGHLPSPYEFNKNNIFASNVVGQDGRTQSFAFGHTYLFGPSVVQAFRLTADRIVYRRLLSRDLFSWADMGVKMYDYKPKFTVMGVTGGPTLSSGTGGGGGDFTQQLAIFALNDDVSVIRGNHQFAVGGTASRWYANTYLESLAGASANFNGQITGLGMADFLAGNVFAFSQSPPQTSNMAQWFVGAFATDTWKATQRLTLNYGLRWEPFSPPEFLDGTAYFLDFPSIAKGIKTSQYKNAPPGVFYPGDPGLSGNQVMYRQWKNFSPRVGLAWDVNGDGRTSVRAGFGTFYDFSPLILHITTNIAPPFDPRVTASNAKLDDPWANVPGGNPFPISASVDAPFPAYSVYAALNRKTKNPSVAQWNLSIQRQIGNDWLVSGTYLGSNTVHMWTVGALNPAVYLPGASCTLAGVTYTPCSSTANTDQRRVLSLQNPQVGQSFGFVNQIDGGASANYHGMVLSAQRRATRGVTINANYTWSHCISDPYFTMTLPGIGASVYTHPDNRRADRGNCSSASADRRHILNLTAVAETPGFTNRTLRAIAAGWRFSPIVRIQSGSFFSITTTQDVALNSITNQRVNQVMSDVYGSKTASNYLNPAAFALPAVGTYGNSGANSVRGPGYWTFDAALSRSFSIREKDRLEFRAEAFNIPNAVRLNNPTANFSTNTFGQINTAQDPRILQFALKYVF